MGCQASKAVTETKSAAPVDLATEEFVIDETQKKVSAPEDSLHRVETHVVDETGKFSAPEDSLRKIALHVDSKLQEVQPGGPSQAYLMSSELQLIASLETDSRTTGETGETGESPYPAASTGTMFSQESSSVPSEPPTDDAFEFYLKRYAFKHLGLALWLEGKTLKVKQVLDSGAIVVAHSHPKNKFALQKGDVILSINGYTDEESMLRECREAQELRLKCQRIPSSNEGTIRLMSFAHA